MGDAIFAYDRDKSLKTSGLFFEPSQGPSNGDENVCILNACGVLPMDSLLRTDKQTIPTVTDGAATPASFFF